MEKITEWQIDDEPRYETWIETVPNEFHGRIKVARVFNGNKPKSEIKKVAQIIAQAPKLINAVIQLRNTMSYKEVGELSHLSKLALRDLFDLLKLDK